MTDRLRVSTEDGKYTYVQREDGSTYALRHGEPWMDNFGVMGGPDGEIVLFDYG